MEPTTGLILRRITQTDLSVSAHKLATVILDAIAWKEGYNGLPRGTAAFTLADLASKMGISRQYLTELLAELEASELELRREKPNGKFAPWLFRFTVFDAEGTDQDVESGTGDTSLSRDKDNKTVFSGQITISAGSNVFQTCWAELIKAAKKALPCWNIDTQVIWDRFLAPDPRERELHDQIKAAPSGNRQFHASDLCRLIGQAAYDARILEVIRQFGCPRFTATLAVHGQAVMAGEIAR